MESRDGRRRIWRVVWVALVFVGGVGLGLVVSGSRTGGEESEPALPSALSLGESDPLNEALVAYQQVDPEQVLYQLDHTVQLEVDELHGLDVDSRSRILVGTTGALLRLSPDGSSREIFSLPATPTCLRAMPEAQMLVGLKSRVLWLDSRGCVVRQSPSLGEKAWLTAVEASVDRWFAADFGQRVVHVMDSHGALLFQVGKHKPFEENPGFLVPSPLFDLCMASDGFLRVVNPGRLRIESYSTEGRWESAWGTSGMDAASFCGCCNPAHIDLFPDGRVLTMEKGLNRVKVYAPDGRFLGFVCPPLDLASGTHSRAVPEVSAGQDGRVVMLDSARRQIHFFKPKRR